MRFGKDTQISGPSLHLHSDSLKTGSTNIIRLLVLGPTAAVFVPGWDTTGSWLKVHQTEAMSRDGEGRSKSSCRLFELFN